MPDTAAIEMVGLSKTYGSGVQALVDLDLRVDGATSSATSTRTAPGKSTTIRLLVDLIRRTAGHAALLGLDTQRDSLESSAGSGTSRVTSGSPTG